MKLNDTINKRLWRITEPVCAGAGYELIDVVLTQSRAGWVLRVFIDHLPTTASDQMSAASAASASSDANTANASNVSDDRPDDDRPDDDRPDDDRPDDDRSDIGFDDCERISRELSAVLDVEDPIEHPYNLEVSSPGLDRPLRTPAHFQRYLGETAKVSLYQGVAGRRNFKGTLVSLEQEQDADATAAEPLDSPPEEDIQETAILIMNVDGTEYRLPFNDIETARLVPDWDSVFQRGRRR